MNPNCYICTAESSETGQLSQAGPSGLLQTTNIGKRRANVETVTPVNSSKVIDNIVPSSSKKRSYEELCSNDAPSCSGKRSYEHLFGDISDLLATDISSTTIACCLLDSTRVIIKESYF